MSPWVVETTKPIFPIDVEYAQINAPVPAYFSTTTNNIFPHETKRREIMSLLSSSDKGYTFVILLAYLQTRYIILP